MLDARRAAADQMADVQLGHFIVGQIQGLNFVAFERREDFFFFGAAGDFQPGEHMGFFRVGIAVIEFRHVAAADQFAETFEAARRFRDRRGEHRFALLAEFRPFGNEAQAVEIHIRAAQHRAQRHAADAGARNVFFCASHAQCAGRLDDGARVLKNIFHRRTDFVGIHQNHVVDILPRQAKGFFPDLFDGDAIGEQAHVR